MEPRKAFLLRLSPELWTVLEGWAQEEMRSINGQIEYLLRQAAAQRKRSPPTQAGGKGGPRRA